MGDKPSRGWICITPKAELCFEGLKTARRPSSYKGVRERKGLQAEPPRGGDTDDTEPCGPVKTDFTVSHMGSQWKVGAEEWHDSCNFSKNRSGCCVKKKM